MLEFAAMSALVEVQFEPDGKAVWVKPETPLLEAAEAAGVDIITGCTRGMCGTDVVLVRSGVEGLSAAEDHERGTLDRMGLDGGYRLACSVKVLSGPISIELGTF